MNRIRALLPLAALAASACAAPAVRAPEPGLPAGSGSMQAPAAAPESFVLLQGNDTIAVETFTRTATTLQAELSARTGGRFSYDAQLAADGTVPRIELRAFTPGTPAGGAPAQRAIASFRGESVSGQSFVGDSSRTATVATTRGAIPYVNPSPSLMEQIVRRARALGGAEAQVPVFIIGAGQTLTATVRTVGADSAVLSLGGTDIRARVDRAGALLGASVGAQNLRIVRRP